MFYTFPYWDAGFSEEEWENMPRGDKVLIRDYYLNGRNAIRTVLYDEYMSDYQMDKMHRQYHLEGRPNVCISIDSFNIYS